MPSQLKFASAGPATGDTKIIRSVADGPANLGIFRLTVLGVRQRGGTTVVEAVNSSATTLVGVRPADDGIRLGCRETTNFTLDEIFLRVTGKKVKYFLQKYIIVTFIHISYWPSKCRNKATGIP